MSNATANPSQRSIAPRAITALLWASAAVLSLLVIVQAATWLDAQPLDAKAQAASGMVTASGPFVVMSSEIGKEDLIVVLDNRSESLRIYHLDQNNQPQLYQQLRLPRIFAEARARGPGRR